MALLSKLDKIAKLPKFVSINLLNSAKSSNFAPDFAPNASERLNDANDTEKRNAENQPLTKKVKK